MQREGSGIEDQFKPDRSSVDDDPARLGKHNGDAPADARLHLPQPPVGTLGVADDHAGLKELVHDGRPDRDLDRLDMAGLVGSRIYHDIINPLGAIGNGVQLLGMEGQPVAPVLGLISQSVDIATARLRFLRLAFGSGNRAGTLAGTEISSLLAEVSRHGRVKYDWPMEVMIPAAAARLILTCALCLESCLPVGGVIRIQRRESGWHLRSESGRLRDLPEMWRVFEADWRHHPVEPAMLQFALAPALADRMGGKLAVLQEPGGIEIEVILPDTG